MKLPQLLMDNIGRCRYTVPTPIQKHAIPIAVGGRDLIGCAQTGSGKTAAFMFAIITRILANQDPSPQSETATPKAVIIAPTRELAVQIFHEAQKFCFKIPIRPCVVYGGQARRPQMTELSKGCDIIIGTPGRMNDFCENGAISLAKATFLVLDEADRMLDLGFMSQISSIINDFDMPKQGRQTLMFSATFEAEMQATAQRFLTNPVFMAVGKVGSSTDLITQRLVQVPEFEKKDTLVKLVRSHPSAKRVLVFVERKSTAAELENHMEGLGFYVTSIHGDRDQSEREEALNSFARGHFYMLIATDVAARGLDVDGIDIVINYDMPKQLDSYIHRIGRTGRCGRRGMAVSFVNDRTSESVLRALGDTLKETNQLVPDWLQMMTEDGRYSTRQAPIRTGGGGRYGSMEKRGEPTTGGFGGDNGGAVVDTGGDWGEPAPSSGFGGSSGFDSGNNDDNADLSWW